MHRRLTPKSTLENLEREATLHAERVASFLRNACLDWRTGGSRRTMAMHAANRMLTRHPEIAHDSIFTAVACGDVQHVERVLAEKPRAASDAGGPREWPPLLYLCAARLPFDAAGDNAVAIATRLLDHGADPNAFYPGGSPQIHYTALTCVLGDGEENASRHPHATALTELLLERGAEPYDMQVLYNTHFHGDILWLLELMYEHSVRAGREADWRDPEWRMLGMGGYGTGARYLLTVAVDQDDLALAEWILAHGATPNPEPPPGRSLTKLSILERALRDGRTEIAELLIRHGAQPVTLALKDEEAFAAACFELDLGAATAMAAAHPEYLTSTKAIFDAARRDRADVVEFLLALGVSPNAADDTNARALHETGYHNALRAATLLIERGADIDAFETNWGNSPLGAALWARHQRMIDYFSPMSRDLWCLTYTGNVERVRAVLAAEPALANVTGDGFTPLMWLPDDEARAMQIVELFLANGADPLVKDKQGLTAADHARTRGMDDVAARLTPRPATG